MNPPVLSIVTINLNHREGLIRTRKSVEAQGAADFEWIVVDGESADGSLDVIKAKKPLYARWISESDSGVYEAMNKGWKLASGDYVLFLNSGDSLVDGTVIRRVLKVLAAGGADVYYGDAFKRNAEQEWVEVRYPECLTLSQFHRGGLCHQAEFIRRAALERFSGYDETYRIGADWDLLVRMLMAGVKTEHLAFPIVYYEGGGLSQQLIDLREEEKQRIFSESVPPAVDRDVRDLVRCRKELCRLREMEAWLESVRKRNVLVNMAMVVKWALTRKNAKEHVPGGRR